MVRQQAYIRVSCCS